MAEADSEAEALFHSAAEYARSRIGTLTNEQILHLYGLYKQATQGPNTQPKPSFWNVTLKHKWEAWITHGTKTKERAMEEYVAAIFAIEPHWMEEPKSKAAWIHHSILHKEEDPVAEGDQDLFYWVKENKVCAIKKAVEAGAAVNLKDEDGLTLLHWAADRGHAEVIRYLADKADPNAEDEEGQTPLHYAASCGHHDAIIALLPIVSTTCALDANGQTPSDVAAAPDIKKLIDDYANSSSSD